MTRAKDIFLDAVDLDDDERDAFLDRACAGDDSLREEVESLLRAESEAGGFMGGAEETVGADDPVDAELGPGTVIGDYTLVRELGEGGFGTVYLARQEQPVRRDVALKVVKAGMDTRQVIRRFRAERQSLAVMNHPGIAKVFDAGTVRGRPYFVMEYVDGDPITDYADRARLTARQRLQLFERVCLAVQHAHSKGVVHRDIKPSNVLVTTVDGVPSPKVIDFGIAKAVQGEDSDRSVVTHAAQIVGTPQYMAPEQASTQHADVDTRADVYSLGVLLYELLTGVTPHDRERFRSAAPADLARLLHEEEPPLPSSRVGNLGDAGDPIAHARRVDTHHLWRALRGDLDWIVMRAIERDRSRRYPTPNALAADIARFLRHEPVEAGPPSRAYRVSKFARRHRATLAIGAVVGAAIVTLAVVGFWFGLRERAARRAADVELAKSRSLAEFAQSIFSGVDPAEARGQDTTLLRSILAGAGERVESELSDQPNAAVEMLNMVGKSYLSLGAYDEAETHFRRAVEIGQAGLGPTDSMTLTSRANVVSVLMETNRFEEAAGELESLLEIRRELFEPDHPETQGSLSSLAYLYQQTGRYEEAVGVLEPLYETRRRIYGPDHEDTLLTQNNLASALTREGDRERAAQMFEEVLEQQAAKLGDDHPRTLATMNNLAGSYSALGREEEARDVLLRVLEVKRRVLDPGHPSLVTTLYTLGGVMTKLERFDDAERYLTESLEGARNAYGQNHLRTATVLNSLGQLEHERGRSGVAVAHAEESMAIFEALGQTGHPSMLILRGNRARFLLGAGDAETALASIEQVLDEIADRSDVPTRLVLDCERIRGRAMARLGRGDVAVGTLTASYEALASERGADDPESRRHAEAIADIAADLGQDDLSGTWRERAADTESP